MSTTLPLFWHLSSSSKKERIDASVKLVSSLEQFQAQFVQKTATRNSGSDDEENEGDGIAKAEDLDTSNAQDVSYSIKRLIRGLASSRESSRLGFAVALTELLARIDTVSSTQIFNLIIYSTKNLGSMNGQEERDVLFAQLFGIMSIIQSGLIVRTKPLPNSSSILASSSESYEQIISQLQTLGEKKSWLRESAWFTINLAIDTLHGSDALWRGSAIEKTLRLLFVQNTTWSTEKIALASKLQNFYPNHDWTTLFSPVFKHNPLLSSRNLLTIAQILKESATDDDDTMKVASATWKPQLNFAWEVILDQFFLENQKKTPLSSFSEFYRVIVEEALFASTSSPLRKFWGFQVFQKALWRIPEDEMPMLFTKNFMRTWINHLSKKDRYLHKIAQQTAVEVQTFVKNKPHCGFALILQLTGVNGNQQFDKLTKTKTVETIVTSMDTNGIQSYIEVLFSQIDEPEGNPVDIAATNSRRNWIVEQLGAFIRNGKIPKEDGWVKNILDWLVVHGLFTIKKKSSKSPLVPLRTIPRPAFSEELKKNIRNRLWLCLGDLVNQTVMIKRDDRMIKRAGCASDGEFWMAKVLSTVELLQDDEKHILPVAEINKDEATLLSDARITLSNLKIVSNPHLDSVKGAELLILSTLLQYHCAGDEEVNKIRDVLETCISAASRMFLVEHKVESENEDKNNSIVERTDDPVDVFVDTIIGFLEHSTSYMRTIGNEVFSLLTDSVKDSTIDLIVSQLELRSRAQLMDEDGDDMEEEEEEVGSDSGSSDEGNATDTGDEEVDTELKNKLEEALLVNGTEPATGDEDEEELMDDDQMMAIDEQLAQVFRSRNEERKSGKNVDAQREATHFKNRVLDLVETFLKKQPSNPLVLRLIVPLIDIVAFSGQDELQLADKARGILHSRFAKMKDSLHNVDIEQALVVATHVHTQARRAHSSDFLSVLSSCSIYLVKVLLHQKAEDQAVEMYKQSLSDFARRKNSALNSHFFQEFVKRFPGQAWRIRQDLLDSTRSAINAFRKCQVLQLLDLLITKLPSSSEHNTEIIKFMPSLKQLLLDVANDSCSGKTDLSPPQMKDVFKLGLVAIRKTKHISSSAVYSAWEPLAWKDLQAKLDASRFESSLGLQKMCNEIVHMAEATRKVIPENSKRKVEDDGATQPETKRKRKKVGWVPEQV